MVVIIQGWPRDSGPGVIELPEKRSHTVRHAGSVGGNSDFNWIGLVQLADVNVVLEISGQIETFVNILIRSSPTHSMLLMKLQFTPVFTYILLLQKSMHIEITNAALHPILGHEPSNILPITINRAIIHINLPIMLIPVLETERVVVVIRRRGRFVVFATIVLGN